MSSAQHETALDWLRQGVASLETQIRYERGKLDEKEMEAAEIQARIERLEAERDSVQATLSLVEVVTGGRP